jgi:hypothetical protein
LKLNNYEKRIEILKSDLEFLQNLKDTCTSREEYTMKIEQLKTIRGPCDLEKQVFDDIFLKTRSVTDMDLRLVALYFTPCDDSNRGAVIEYLFLNPSNDDPPIWYHEKIPMRIFTSEGTTWFEFPNFQKQIKLKRKTSNLFRKCAKKMDELNIKYKLTDRGFGVRINSNKFKIDYPKAKLILFYGGPSKELGDIQAINVEDFLLGLAEFI